MSRKTLYQTNLAADQLDRLRALSLSSRVPIAELIRQGVDLLLEKRDTEVQAGLVARARGSS